MYYINLNNPLNKRINFENQCKIAYQIGISPETLCRILKGKQATKKATAYCIVKLYDSEAEILDYFTREDD